MFYLYRDCSVNEIADLLLISAKSVNRILNKFYETGDVQCKEQVHGPERKLDALEEAILIEYLIKNPNVYLDELQRELQVCVSMVCSLSTICRTLSRLGVTCKKLQHIVLKCSEDCRTLFREEMNLVNADMIVWINETGTDRQDANRCYGYHLCGVTPASFTLAIRGKRISAITALSIHGIEDVCLAEGSVDGDLFVHFVEHSLLSLLQPFNGSNARSIVVMDNASVHHVDRVVSLITSAGAILRFLPPYSLDLQPLEEAFSKVKYFLKRNEVIYDSTHLNKLIYKHFLLLQLSYCVSVLLVTSGCKSAAAQYKRHYHMAPP